MNDEFLVAFGSEVKASANGRFTGYLVRFSSADSPDLAGEFFTKDTDFGIVNGQKTPVFFNHRLPLMKRDGSQIIVKQKIGEASMTMDEEGVLLDAIVWNRNNYEKDIIRGGRKNMLGWSSGTAPHLVDYEPAGKSRFIKSWPLGLDASLTPIPCEPQNNAISLRSYSEALSAMKFAPIDMMFDDGADDDSNQVTIEDAEQKVASFDTLDIDTHSRLTVIAMRGITSRFHGNHDARLKAGRVLSEKNRRRIKDLMGQLMSVHGDLQGLMDDSMTGDSMMDAEKRARQTKELMAKYRYDRR